MNLSWIDWLILAVAVVSLRFVSLRCRGQVKGVADFLSANRCAGRYLLTIANQMGGTAPFSVVQWFEAYFVAGFAFMWWGFMSAPIPIIILLLGWVFYRFRETRALTMAQYLEMRYSRRFRVFAGAVCFVSGILNFGIFPAVAARFFMYFCGLPDWYHIPGLAFHLPTFASIMIVDLALALTFVNMGGLISVMVTECVQGIFAGFVFLVVTLTMLTLVTWPQVIQALNTAPSNASMLNPFHTGGVKDFNVWFALIGIFSAFYSNMSWQGSQGYFSAARTPHEQRMGGLIGVWRALPLSVMAFVVPICAFTVMTVPAFAAKAAAVNHVLKSISNPEIARQMTVPILAAKLLPVGVKGLLATAMLFFSFTCHDTYMHSWGSIFIQDIILPFRKRPLSPEQHIRWLRRSIFGVAVFIFLFSLLYPQTTYIVMFSAITGTIWVGGSGAVIIGGLYWRRGTTAAAYAALITGSALGLAALVVPPIYRAHLDRDFPINGMILMFIGMLAAVSVYVVVSMLTSRNRPPFDITKMLGRDKLSDGKPKAEVRPRQSKWLLVTGITEEFSRFDRIIAASLVLWSVGWFVTFIVVTALHFSGAVPNAWWPKFWHFYIMLLIAISVPVLIWTSIGGIWDIRSLFRSLATSERNTADDGRVSEDHADASAGGSR
jgi:SSS family solute:Na+ symporter